MKEKFVHFPNHVSNPTFFIELAGISYCDGSYKIHRPKAPCLVMEYVISGEGTIFLDKKQYHAKEGDVYLLPPEMEHLYFSDAHNPWVKIWFNAQGPLISALLNIYNPKNMVVFPNAGGKDFFVDIHNIGKDTSMTGNEKHEKAAVNFHQLLQYLHDKFYSENITYSEESIRLKTYIDNNITQDITLKALGELVHLSESQIIRIFKRDYGKTPYEYVLEWKMNQAKLLLQNTRLMVKEIAVQLGFCDEHYFSYLFRKKTGQTPTAYRNKFLC